MKRGRSWADEDAEVEVVADRTLVEEEGGVVKQTGAVATDYSCKKFHPILKHSLRLHLFVRS